MSRYWNDWSTGATASIKQRAALLGTQLTVAHLVFDTGCVRLHLGRQMRRPRWWKHAEHSQTTHNTVHSVVCRRSVLTNSTRRRPVPPLDTGDS